MFQSKEEKSIQTNIFFIFFLLNGPYSNLIILQIPSIPDNNQINKYIFTRCSNNSFLKNKPNPAQNPSILTNISPKSPFKVPSISLFKKLGS
ncbi:hypothetical protein CHT99_05830 [Sphingobacterium cellulitidis]|nr:hypothetical protein CHT99_05830 [Sphingobacterium cellulitidis]